MATFAENLQDLPSISHISSIDVTDKHGNVVANIPNQPGKQGSLKLVNYLNTIYDGRIGPVAAAKGLEIFAEHVEDAVHNPGKHPNIDLLLDLAAKDSDFYYIIKVNLA